MSAAYRTSDVDPGPSRQDLEERLLARAERIAALEAELTRRTVGRALALSGVTAGVTVLAIGMVALLLAPPPPPVALTPEPCRDSAEVISNSTTNRRCDPGATMQTEHLHEDRVLVRCVCAKAPAPAAKGAP